jgi:purine-nucleoside phosphorylase, family 1 (deoD)
MATPHNAASSVQIAKTVLLPGDPLRARYIAQKYLPDSVQITGVRNMLGFTGSWQGKPLTVMGSGMGGPSAGIYSYELFKLYGVESIIRIGTAGGLQESIAVGDLVVAMNASTDSNYAYQYRLPGTYSPSADFSLLERAVSSARARSLNLHVGSVFSSDLFSEYNALGPEESWKPWARMGCLVQDMETYALYCNAAWLGKKAVSILTHTDSCVTGEGLPEEKRLTALHSMFEVALEIAR